MKKGTIAIILGAILATETALGGIIPASVVRAEDVIVELASEVECQTASEDASCDGDIIIGYEGTDEVAESDEASDDYDIAYNDEEIVIYDGEGQITIDDEELCEEYSESDDEEDVEEVENSEQEEIEQDDIWEEDDIVIDDEEDDVAESEEWISEEVTDTDRHEENAEETDEADEKWEDGTVVGFGDFNPDDHSVSVVRGQKPALNELMAEFPEQITLKLEKDGKERYQKVNVSWYCVGDDYVKSSGFYFQFSPKWDESAYSLQSGINVETQGPYIPVYVTVNQNGSNGRVAGMDGIRLSDDQIEANKQAVYDYIVGTMGLNSAAACGVMANIQYESGFNNTIYGDGGTSYGLCQWHNSRFTNLRSYCASHGYDYTSVDGQLHYLEHELNNSYTGVLNYLKDVANNEEGAYNAAYYWCVHFEVPADKYTKAQTRGNLAKSTYWPKYGNTKPTKVKPTVFNIKYIVGCGVNNPANPATYTSETDTITLLDPIILPGFKFVGWYKFDRGSLIRVKTIEKGSEGDLTLYAKVDKIKYTIKFYGNGAKSGSMSVMKNCLYNNTYTLNKNKYKRTGYTFKNWNTKKDGSGQSYKDKGAVKNLRKTDGTVKLYAQWTPIKYNVKYDKNGGSGKTMKKSKNVKYDKKFTLRENTYTKKGYVFAGWNTKRNGTGHSYVDEQEVYKLSTKAGATVTLYAQWEPEVTEADEE